jgi:hypothetical protein
MKVCGSKMMMTAVFCNGIGMGAFHFISSFSVCRARVCEREVIRDYHFD